LSLEESLGVPWAVICTLLSVIVLSDSDLAVALVVLEFSNPDSTESESESRRIENTIGNHRNCLAATELATMFMRMFIHVTWG
jgi:hypothetical protein